MDDIHTERKKHKERQAGVKAEKKKAKIKPDPNLTPIQRNPKAFSVQHAQKTARYAQRSQEIKNKKHHIPLVDRTPLDPPPVIIGVVGPPKVGKTTLLQGIVKNYAKQKLTNVQGPVTIVSGKKRRLTLMECNNDINSMIDIAKVADLVLLLVDASFGFEMETFEFLNICQVHGFPKIMGVLTHLDRYKDNKKMRKMKKRFKHRFWTEVYAGAKLFYLSGMVYGEYPKQQVFNLCRFISVMKFRPLTWRTTHPYILADRMEDITDPEKVRKNEKTDRNVSIYGYVHGTMMKNNVNIHIPGCGDFSINEIQLISDPCPTPDKEKKVRSLTQKDRIIYAPMSGVGGIVYDKDAVYIDVAGQQPQTGEQEQENPSNELVSSLMSLSNTLDEKISASDVAMFSETTEKSRTVGRVLCESPAVKFVQTADGRFRRLAVFDEETKGKEEKSPADDDNDDESDDDDDDDEQEDDNDEDEMDSEEEDNNLEDPLEPPKKKHKTETPKKKDKMEKVPDEDLAYADTDDEMADISIFSTSTVVTPKHSNKLVLTPGQSIKSDNSDDSIDYDNDSSDEEIDSDNENKEKDTSLKSGISKSPLINKSSIEGSSKSTSAKSKSPALSSGSKKNMSGDRKSGDRKLGELEDSSDDESSESESDEDNIVGGDEKQGMSSQSAKGKSPALTSSSQKNVSTAKKDFSDSDGSNSDSEDEDDEIDSDVDETMDMHPRDDKSPVLSSGVKKNVLSKEEDLNIKDSKSPLSSSSSKEKVLTKKEDSDEESGSESEDESEDQEEEDDFDSGDASIRWKSNLAEEAAASFRARQASRKNYRKIIYGEEVIEEDQTEADTDEIGGLFRIIKEKNEKTKQARVGIDRTDCSKRQKSTVKDWSLDQLQEAITDCFVTGKWDQSNDAEAQLNMDDELYGDFEDLETGEKHAAVDKDKVKQEEDSAMDNPDAAENSEETTQRKTKAEMTADERRAEKKRKLKEMFNAQYDDKGSTDFYDAWKAQTEQQAQGRQNQVLLKEMFNAQYDVKGSTEFYDVWKAQTEQQAQMNRSEFEDLDDDLRVQYEGYRPGMYVRVEINNVPCELVTNFDPTYPLILGGLLSGESNIGYVQTRFKKHRWHKKILKTKNPLIVSLGWRRFQSIPIYSIQDHNMRNRLLKYTPEHLHCHASLWGPITPQGTGLLAVESVSGTHPGFRIAGTGVVLELDKSMQIVKKLKLTGTPNKIYKKTAFIEGMFNSSLEVSKFEGASIRTVSGIRGQIKKAMSNPEGCYRATFEDQIVMGDIVFLRSWFPVEVPQFYNPVTSLLLPKGDKQTWTDIVFLRSWFPVEVPQFYNPVTSLLLPKGGKQTWTGMKTLGQLQYERSLKPDNNQDSTYKEIVRPKKTYNPLVIPKNLKKNLPFKVTPKDIKPQDSIDRIAVVREPHEKKIAKVLKMMKTLHEHKQLLDHQRNVERVRKHQKEAGKIWDSKTRKQKERKKSYFKKLVRNPKLAYQSQ